MDVLKQLEAKLGADSELYKKLKAQLMLKELEAKLGADSDVYKKVKAQLEAQQLMQEAKDAAAEICALLVELRAKRQRVGETPAAAATLQALQLGPGPGGRGRRLL